MRSILRLCLALVLSSGIASAQKIINGDAHYMETKQFQFISEFFLGHEVQGNRTILRTQDDSRQGLYFTLKLTKAFLGQSNLQAILEVIPADDKETASYSFDLSSEKIKKNLYLGLTGADWVDPSVQPMAWRVRILSGKQEITSWQSFLWEMPAK